jgi:hypothetical protein
MRAKRRLGAVNSGRMQCNRGLSFLRKIEFPETCLWRGTTDLLVSARGGLYPAELRAREGKILSRAPKCG